MGDAEALSFLHGARFVKAALQINPFEYLLKNAKFTPFKNEDEYNAALIQQCLDSEIRLIGITDHYAIKHSMHLIHAATEAGIVVFPGFEAVTSEGIHALCLFGPDAGEQKIERCIGACGVHDEGSENRLGSVSLDELIRLAAEWDAVIIAAHITGSGGLLTHLEGRARQNAWTNEGLTAAALHTPEDRLDRGKSQMIRGTIAGYKRTHPIALLYAADVSHPDKLLEDVSWSWIKLSETTIDGLRHSFLDPGSRVRLSGDHAKSSNRRIVSVKWKGGFLDGVFLPLNPALNVLVGPRGSGKSTVLESIRFVLGSTILGNDAKDAHNGIVSKVLGPGTKVTLEIANARFEGIWSATRTVSSDRLVVVGPDGITSDVTPLELIGVVDVFGQHEIAELARMPKQRSRLLDRFLPSIPEPKNSRMVVAADLATNREAILDVQTTQETLNQDLADLPAIKARLAKYKSAGVEKNLEKQAGYRREEPILNRVDREIDTLESDLAGVGAIDTDFISDESIDGLPSRAELRSVRRALETLESSRKERLAELKEAAKAARRKLELARSKRKDRQDSQQDTHMSKLRSLHAENIDGEQYLALVEKLAELAQEEKRLKSLRTKATELAKTRKRLLDEWYALQQREHDRLKVAAKQVTDGLKPAVRIVTELRGDRQKLAGFLRDHMTGQLHNVTAAVQKVPNLGPREFAAACRKGPDVLEELLGTGGKQVGKVCDLEEAVLLELEELWLESTTSIDLKVGIDADGKPMWRGLEQLSTGQKATAILLVLLLDSPDSSPLLVDQPEDDLDSAFIADDVVLQLRSEKNTRQFLLSTHNPNIPVLGDAEQVIRLTTAGEAAAGGSASIKDGHTGSIDRTSIRHVLEALEGGRQAFETRRRRYGY